MFRLQNNYNNENSVFRIEFVELVLNHQVTTDWKKRVEKSVEYFYRVIFKLSFHPPRFHIDLNAVGRVWTWWASEGGADSWGFSLDQPVQVHSPFVTHHSLEGFEFKLSSSYDRTKGMLQKSSHDKDKTI